MTVAKIGPVTLIHGDAYDVLPDLAGQCALCVTDFPYELTSGGRGETGDTSMSGIFDAEAYDNSGCLMATANWGQMIPPIYRALKRNADSYFMCNDKNILLAGGALIGAGFKFHNLLGWDKGAPTRNRWYMKNMEFTLYAWKGQARPITEPGSKQLWTGPRPKLGLHPTEKPVGLMRHYIHNSSPDPDDIVLDLFCGSGSTLLAAAQLGRRAIGIELEREFFDVAKARLEAARAEGSFVEGLADV
jgi:site-specific DNA-methyltransferase (adenine-specific)